MGPKKTTSSSEIQPPNGARAPQPSAARKPGRKWWRGPFIVIVGVLLFFGLAEIAAHSKNSLAPHASDKSAGYLRNHLSS